MDGLIFLRALWDRIAAWAFIIGGGLLIVDAGQHARNAVFAADSFSFLTSGGLTGLAAVVIGCALLVSGGFHDEWRKLDRIEAALSSAVEPSPAAAGGPTRWLRAEADRTAGWALVVGAGVWLAIGSRLVAGALYTPKQVTYVISGGVAALAVLMAGLAGLLLADTRDEERKLDRIDALLPPDGSNGDGWPRRSRPVPGLVAAAALAVGVICVAIGWWKAADAIQVEAALDGLLVAVIGAGLVAGGLVVSVAARRGRLLHQARRVLRRAPAPALSGLAEPHRNGADSTRWTAEGLERFHLPACPVLAGIDSTRLAAVPVGSKLEPCLLCEAGE